MICARFKSEAWNTLVYHMIITGLKEKDYSFFTSDFYKGVIADFLNQNIKSKINELVEQWENERREKTGKGIECTKTLTDNGFVKMFNLFGDKRLSTVSK